MKIVLMRHGEASHHAANDDDRELTAAGRDRIIRHIVQRKDELSHIQLFLSSPIRRARQTADLALEVLGLSQPIEEVVWLRHESNPRDAITALSAYTASSIMLFSHQPFSSAFVERLCGLPRGEIMLNTASMIAMEADPLAEGLASLLWQVHA